MARKKKQDPTTRQFVDALGTSPLDEAALLGLLDQGASIEEGFDYFGMVAMEGSVELTQRFIDAGADLQMHTKLGTPLTMTAGRGHAEVVRVLLKAHQTLDQSTLRLPLNRAIERGHREVALILAEALTDAGGVPEKPDLQDPATLRKPGIVGMMQALMVSPLAAAARRGWDDVVERLLAKGLPADDRASIAIVEDGDIANFQGAPALLLAAAYGHASTVAQLLNAGADPAATDEEGRTAADVAEARGHAEVAAQLTAAARG